MGDGLGSGANTEVIWGVEIDLLLIKKIDTPIKTNNTTNNIDRILSIVAIVTCVFIG
jgi:hypothetical protein